MAGVFDNLLFCGKHKCPMIKIGDSYCCALEYLDEKIGNRKITSIKVIGGRATIFFDDLIKLPLTCPHCGSKKEAHIDYKIVPHAVGLYVVALSYDENDKKGGVFSMHFSDGPEKNPIEGAIISCGIESIPEMTE